ncbi:MAG: DNA-binding response regulator [Acutalibacteraceae bacterium]
MINTILVEDDLYIQKHFIYRLSSDAEINLISAVRDAFEAEKLCSKHTDLVLMDVLTLHKHSGLAAGKRIKTAFPHIKVVIITSLVDPEVLLKAKTGCADSLWYKDHSIDEILDVIHRTLAGEHIFPDFSPSVEMKKTMSDKFSPAQIEILRAFIKGYTYKEIAAKFKLSVNGVRWNIDEMVRIGGFKNKEELTTTAIENKLVVTTLQESEEE